MVYLDYAATTPLRQAARDAAVAALEVFGNPSSVHQAGQQARFVVDTARRQVAELLAVRPEQVVFTSSGSEANNLALRGVMAATSGKRLLTTELEHPCVLNTAKALAEQGMGVTYLPLTQTGEVDLAALKTELAKGDVGLVSVMQVNNENGLLQPVSKVAALCREHGVLCHTDAVQGVGHVDGGFAALDVDLLTLSSHKIGGPKGAAALIIRGKPNLLSHTTGGAQERNRRAGTENTSAYAGFGAAAAELTQTAAGEMSHQQALKAQLEQALLALDADIKIVGHGQERAPHITQIITPLKAEDALIALDLAGFAISQGSACSSGRTEPSYVLQALGYSADEAGRGLRISTGFHTTAAEIEGFVKALGDLLKR